MPVVIFIRFRRVVIVIHQVSNFSSISWGEQVTFLSDDVYFVLDQHPYSWIFTRSLKRQSAGR